MGGGGGGGFCFLWGVLVCVCVWFFVGFFGGLGYYFFLNIVFARHKNTKL